MFSSVPPVHLALLCPGLVTLAPLLARAGLALRAFALPLGSSTHYSVAMCHEEYDCTYAHVLTCTLTCVSTLAHTALTRMHARSHSISPDFFSVLITTLRPTGRYFPYENICLDRFSVGEFNALNV